MRKLLGEKQKMTQIFKDGAALGVTPIKLAEKSNLEGLEAGMELKVSGTSKGHGFTGVVKRWNFAGGPKTHGNKHHERAPGSIGSKNMARVVKGRKMAGRYGMERISYKGIKIAEIDADNGIIMIHGSAPGIVGRQVELVAPVDDSQTDADSSTQTDAEKSKAEEKTEGNEVDAAGEVGDKEEEKKAEEKKDESNV
jgi:ribosomal protein L3